MTAAAPCAHPTIRDGHGGLRCDACRQPIPKLDAKTAVKAMRETLAATKETR